MLRFFCFLNEIMPFEATLMDLEIIILIDKLDRQTIQDITYVESKKKNTNELIYETETDSQTQKTNVWLSKGKNGEGTIANQEFGIKRHTPLYVKQIALREGGWPERDNEEKHFRQPGPRMGELPGKPGTSGHPAAPSRPALNSAAAYHVVGAAASIFLLAAASSS